jgi:hypothetical protein
VPKPTRLRKHLADMISRESDLGILMSGLAQSSQRSDDVSALLNEILDTSNTQQAALRVRIAAIGGDAPAAEEIGERQSQETEFPVTAALSDAAGALNQAIVG